MATREDTAFELGSIVKVVGTFKTPKTATPPNTNVDPTVTLSIRNPDKTSEVREYGVDALVEKDETGIYSSRITLSQEGTYHWRWAGSVGLDESGVLSGHFDSYRDTNF